MKQFNVDAVTLPDAWFQLVYGCVKSGKNFLIHEGSFVGHIRKEFDWVTIQIEQPFLRCVDGLPLIPEMPEGMDIPVPVTKEYIADYAPYLMTSQYNRFTEAYTYGQRINGYRVPHGIIHGMVSNAICYKPEISVDSIIGVDAMLSQVEGIIWTYKNKGHRNNQMILQIASPLDFLLIDPPCLRHIDTRIQDGKLHFFPYFRSWDLWSGLPANLAGISILQEYMASEIGVDQGEMLCTSKGLHLYDYSVDFAKIRIMEK